MSRNSSADPEVARVHAAVLDKCDQIFRRAQEEGFLRPDVDLVWTRRVYYALIHEAAQSEGEDPDALATRLIDTLLRGVGTDRRL
jgi:hypothetical protein